MGTFYQMIPNIPVLYFGTFNAFKFGNFLHLWYYTIGRFQVTGFLVNSDRNTC